MKTNKEAQRKKSKGELAASKSVKAAKVEDLVAKAKVPGQHAMKLHPHFRGKIETVPKCVVRDFNDFAIWYTPGVAEPCKAIKADPKTVWEHTNKGNTIAVVSDCTRVLGLGDIGPEAGLPVMEGKSLLFKYLGGVDSIPICLDTKDPDKIIEVVKLLQPSFGGINLEDISQPKCFYVLDRLRKEARIPVWHDDQQGTATVVVAGALNALKFVNKKPSEAKVALIGAGASNIAGLRVMIAAGFNPKNVIITDSKGILTLSRKDLETDYKEKWWAEQITNQGGIEGGIPEAMKGADLTIAASRPGPGTIKPEWIKMMASDAIVFPIANPIPEIWPWEAHEAGAKIVATGRSDFPNQVNNSLGFPGIFRGVLDVRASTITDEMCIAAAKELAKTAEDNGLREDYIVPTMDEWEVFPREATAVALEAIKSNVALLKKSRQEIYEEAERIIRRARDETKLLMDKKIIPPAPP